MLLGIVRGVLHSWTVSVPVVGFMTELLKVVISTDSIWNYAALHWKCMSLAKEKKACWKKNDKSNDCQLGASNKRLRDVRSSNQQQFGLDQISEWLAILSWRFDPILFHTMRGTVDQHASSPASNLDDRSIKHHDPKNFIWRSKMTKSCFTLRFANDIR